MNIFIVRTLTILVQFNGAYNALFLATGFDIEYDCCQFPQDSA